MIASAKSGATFFGRMGAKKRCT
ncbi:MAG: hypothetical protein QOF13_2682, partial [Solirubrobacterales bacterium]|nr:hypothetical protein [Solirubrobacterales bacterium]